MRVLHVSSEQSWRGGEQQIAYLIGELNRHGVQSKVIAKRGSAFEDYCVRQKIPCDTARFANELDIPTALAIKSAAVGCDLVHLHSGKGHGLGVLSGLLGMPLPLVLSKRTDHPPKKNWLSLFKFKTDRIKKILCVSEAIKTIVDRVLDDPSRTTTVHSGIDLSKFKFENKFFFHNLFRLPHNIQLVGNVSAISDHKDYFTFVDTAQIVCAENDNVRFLIIGDGPMKDEIRSYVTSKGLTEKVLFTGFLNNIPEVLFGLDVFLITSKEEGLGTAILDAHACRIPVVATNAGGIPEIVINGVSGTLCEIGDSAALAKAVQLRLRDRETFKAYDLVQTFSKEATAKKTLDIYRAILA